MSYDYHIFIVVAMFILLDMISGVMQAIKNKNVSSTVMRDGLIHKATFVMAVALAYACEYGMKYLDLGFALPIMTTTCVFICLIELASILENLGKLNPELQNKTFMRIFDSEKNGDGNA